MKAIAAEQQLPSQKVQYLTALIISTFICSHSLPDSSFAGPRKNTHQIRLLLTHKNGDFSVISACKEWGE